MCNKPIVMKIVFWVFALVVSSCYVWYSFMQTHEFKIKNISVILNVCLAIISIVNLIIILKSICNVK